MSKILASQLNEYICDNNLLPTQSGFRGGHSCRLIKVINDIIYGLLTVLVAVDYSKS